MKTQQEIEEELKELKINLDLLKLNEERAKTQELQFIFNLQSNHLRGRINSLEWVLNKNK